MPEKTPYKDEKDEEEHGKDKFYDFAYSQGLTNNLLNAKMGKLPMLSGSGVPDKLKSIEVYRKELPAPLISLK